MLALSQLLELLELEVTVFNKQSQNRLKSFWVQRRVALSKSVLFQQQLLIVRLAGATSGLCCARIAPAIGIATGIREL